MAIGLTSPYMFYYQETPDFSYPGGNCRKEHLSVILIDICPQAELPPSTPYLR